MFKRSNRDPRSAKHSHQFSVHNVGADLQRQVCGSCGRVSIKPLPPPDLRAEMLVAPNGLFNKSQMTVRLEAAIERVPTGPRFGERRTRR